LPQVARETGWTKEQLLDRLCTEKLGVSAIVWQHPNAKLFKFSSVILGPEAF
jgi:AMMECR1 domain-containing protein